MRRSVERVRVHLWQFAPPFAKRNRYWTGATLPRIANSFSHNYLDSGPSFCKDPCLVALPDMGALVFLVEGSDTHGTLPIVQEKFK
jgi:hypothetical protein